MAFLSSNKNSLRLKQSHQLQKQTWSVLISNPCYKILKKHETYWSTLFSSVWDMLILKAFWIIQKEAIRWTITNFQKQYIVNFWHFLKQSVNLQVTWFYLVLENSVLLYKIDLLDYWYSEQIRWDPQLLYFLLSTNWKEKKRNRLKFQYVIYYYYIETDILPGYIFEPLLRKI